MNAKPGSHFDPSCPEIPSAVDAGAMNELIFILTTRCNQRCTFCCEPPGDGDMHFKDAIRWLELMKFARIPWVDFSGGEPLLYKEIDQLCERASEMGILTTMSTNGLLVARKVDAIFPFINQWNISLHGMQAAHDSIAQHAGSWETIIKSCKLLAGMGATIHITYVVTSENIHDVKEATRALCDAGVKKICFNYVFRRGHGSDYLKQHSVSRDEAYQFVRTAIAEAVAEECTIYHNMNLDGQCALVRANGNVWGVPMANQLDYKTVFHMEELSRHPHTYPYLRNHKKFTFPRLAPVHRSEVEFDMFA